jgi:hypothetical protein
MFPFRHKGISNEDFYDAYSWACCKSTLDGLPSLPPFKNACKKFSK